MSPQFRFVLGGLVASMLTVGAQADLARDLFRSLELYATPSGNVVQTGLGGIRVNGQRQGQIRIEPNQFSEGWELIVDRTFGLDSAGRPETIDLGPIELTLQGSTATTASFSKRGFLEGNLNMIANNLNYQLRTTTGPIDATMTGTFNMNNNLQINQFGFYDLQVDLSQSNSTLLVETLGNTDSTELNYDIGPIDVRGNIFIDAIVGLLSFLGVDTTALEPLTGYSAIAELNRQINDSVAGALADQGYALDTSNGEVALTEIAAATAPILGDATIEIAGPVAGDSSQDPGATAPTASVPEPASLLLCLMLAPLLRRR
jgi:hypothetical protein